MRTIQTIKITFIALMICCNICCDNKANQELQIVEGLLNQDLLDSAYTTFNKIELSTEKTTSDSALYYLLKTEIMWKKEEPFKDDSIINFAIKYYEQHKDQKRLANAYHYKSGILYLKGRKKQAIALEKKAELIAKNLQDDLLNIKIYNNLVYYNSEDNNFQEAEKYCRKKLYIANKIDHNLWKAISLSELASIYLEYKNIDSACYYINMSLPLTKYISQADRNYLLANMGRTLEKIDPQRAISLYEKALLELKDPKLYGFIADAYHQQGKKEKAMILWNKALSTPDLYFQINVLEKQHQYLSEQGREHDAHQVAIRIIALKDSMSSIQQQDSIKEIQRMMEQEYMAQETREERHKLLSICCGLLALFGIVTSVYVIRRKHYRKQIVLHKNDALQNREKLKSVLQTSEQSAKDIKLLHKEVEMLRKNQSQLLAKGKQRYEEIQQGGNTLLWRKPDFTAFMEYYRMQDASFVEQLESKDEISSPRLMMFKTLVHMGYSKERIAKALCVSEDSLRTYKSRVKNNKQ